MMSVPNAHIIAQTGRMKSSVFKLMLIVKCGLTGVVGCVVYVAVSMVLKQTIITDTLKKFKK